MMKNFQKNFWRKKGKPEITKSNIKYEKLKILSICNRTKVISWIYYTSAFSKDFFDHFIVRSLKYYLENNISNKNVVLLILLIHSARKLFLKLKKFKN